MHLAILGRQPLLGLAELERVYGPNSITPIISSGAALVNAELTSASLAYLGGSTKLARILFAIDEIDWQRIERRLLSVIPDTISKLPDGKLRVGMSVYGLQTNAKFVTITNLKLKRAIQNHGRSIRVVPNKDVTLNSAQVLHNQLTGTTGFEIVLVRQGGQTLVAQTIAEQDIESYAARDQARPYRDAFVGMLPPKLAQIMINIASPVEGGTVLDPFCGTGVVLQEAVLLGHPVYGTDLSEKMIYYSERNLAWLQEKMDKTFSWQLEKADATIAKWQDPISAIVSETYLGQPFSAPPSTEKLQQVRGNCNHIISDFLKNISHQIESGTPLCIAVPAWRSADGSLSQLPLISDLDQLGFRRVHCRHVNDKDLIYFRPNQIVARQLLLLIKK